MPLSEPLEKAFQTMNEAQREAAMHGTGPMLVLAGPGSGKTFVITNRISCLIEHYGVPPEHILVITFTKEAAGSMQQRFLASQGRIYPVHFGTFHAVFYQILKQSAPKGVGGILTDSEKKQLMIPILTQFNQEHMQKEKLVQKQELAQNQKPVQKQAAGLSGPSCQRAAGREELAEDAVKCLAAISYYKNTYLEEKASGLLPEHYRAYFPDILTRYEKARAGSGRLDFDDMLFGCLKLLRSEPRILQFWQEKFQYLLIDEFQDINPMQYEVVRLLTGDRENLFAVGDDDQSIYGFRGSEPRLMQQFLKDYPGCRQVLLDTNYRSRAEIVEASLQIINENKDRFPKRLTSAKKSVEKRTDSCPVTIKSFAEKEEEYSYLTEKLRNAPEPEQCAVLFRTNIQMQGFASRLAREEIPYFMKEKCSCVFDHFIAKDLNAYLQFANGDLRRSLFLSIMNKPSRWISREAVTQESVDFEAIRDYYRKYVPPDRCARVLQELKKLESVLLRLKSYSPYLAIQFLRKGAGYEKYLWQRAGTDTRKLSEWMETLEFLTMEAAGYQSYQQWLAMQQRVREEMEKSAFQKQEGKGIRLMTGHASKGLEFKSVFIPDVNEGTFPHGHMPDEQTVEEERRIFYVAMTRAKEALELTYVTGTKERPRLPSRFLNPLLSTKNNPF